MAVMTRSTSTCSSNYTDTCTCCTITADQTRRTRQILNTHSDPLAASTTPHKHRTNSSTYTCSNNITRNANIVGIVTKRSRYVILSLLLCIVIKLVVLSTLVCSYTLIVVVDASPSTSSSSSTASISSSSTSTATNTTSAKQAATTTKSSSSLLREKLLLRQKRNKVRSSGIDNVNDNDTTESFYDRLEDHGPTPAAATTTNGGGGGGGVVSSNDTISSTNNTTSTSNGSKASTSSGTSTGTIRKRQIRFNPSRCRFGNGSKEFVPCLGGVGVYMYTGQRYTNSCKDYCILFPILQPLSRECGDCGDVTQSPTTSPQPSISPKPSRAPTFTRAPIVTFKPTMRPTYNPYDVTLDLVGVPTVDTVAVFNVAAERWSSIIQEDVSNIPSDDLTTPVPYDGCTYPTIIDDLYICAKYENIDGPGNVLGSAGPIHYRASNNLPITGRMRFDTSDIERMRAGGYLQAVILHEMGHVIGIGTIWESLGLIPDFRNCPYSGIYGNAEYKRLTGCNRLPLETGGGAGTACSHFSETCLKNELMTGYITQQFNGNPLSTVTIASLQDLGYKTVNFDEADRYGTSDIDTSCICNRRLEEETEKNDFNNNNNNYNSNEFYMDFIPLNNTEIILQHQQKYNQRRLSEEARTIAITYGKEQLRLAQLEYEASILSKEEDEVSAVDGGDKNTTGSNDTKKTSPIQFMGADVISVVIQDGDNIFAVVVHNT